MTTVCCGEEGESYYQYRGPPPGTPETREQLHRCRQVAVPLPSESLPPGRLGGPADSLIAPKYISSSLSPGLKFYHYYFIPLDLQRFMISDLVKIQVALDKAKTEHQIRPC